jgi:hypothetical protein
MLHKKTIAMNIMGAIAWVALGVALFPNQPAHDPLNMSLSAVLLYALIVSVPLKTAFVLYKQNGFKQNTIAQALNYALIIFFVFSYVGIILSEKNMFTKIFDLPLFISLFVIVIPSLINLRALKQLRS